MRLRRSWLPYLAVAPVLLLAFAVGTRDGDGPLTASDRVSRMAKQVRCPTCEGLSAAESDTPASQAIREEVRRRVETGQSDEEIRAFLVSRYGKDILLTPEATGVASLVWVLPVAGMVVAVVGLALAFRRWRPPGRARVRASPEDLALVDQARGR